MAVHLEVLPDAAAVALASAELVSDAMREGAVRLGAATGATFEPVYRALATVGPDASGVQVWLLDEYVGLEAGHPNLFRSVVYAQLCEPLGIGQDRLHGPFEAAAAESDVDVASAADTYEQQLRRSPVDLQLLGIGTNGHLGFNEPGSPLDSTSRVVRLAEETRADNARHFPTGQPVPTHAITQGIATILGARRLLLVATGEHKATALARALEGGVSTSCPASAVCLHPDATVIADEPAAAQLRA